jgi:hypothetical protein
MSVKLRSKVIVDVAMTVTLFTSFAVGIVLWLVLPSGKGAGQTVFLGLTRHVWNDIHTYSSLAFGGTLLLHLALNWGLFWSMARCMFKKESKAAA